tara:strand:- start:50 stop:256 length:207 start_codon:yes stop_codon:yes gene_type:complete
MKWYESKKVTGDLVKLETDTAKIKDYLYSTDWVETYLLRHDLNIEIIPEDSNKWEIINKRKEAKGLLK